MRVARIVGYFLIALVLLAVVFIDANRFKGYIERHLTDSIGRAVTIAVDFDPGWISRVTLERLRLANAAWSDHSQMVRTTMLDVGINIKALLQGKIVISEVIVKSPQILLQIAGDGRHNWNFSAPQADQSTESRRNAQPEFPAIRRLTITDGRLRYLDHARDVDVQAKVDRLLANVGRGGRHRDSSRGDDTRPAIQPGDKKRSVGSAVHPAAKLSGGHESPTGVIGGDGRRSHRPAAETAGRRPQTSVSGQGHRGAVGRL